MRQPIIIYTQFDDKKVYPSLLKMCFFLFLFFCLAYNGNTQGQIVKYQQITTSDGLPSDYVLDIAFDKKGFAWLATSEGLVRYDGRNFRTYKKNQSKLENIDWNVRHLLILDDKIWFTLNNGDIYYLNKETLEIHFYPLALSQKNFSRNYPYKFLKSDSKGNIWLGMNNEALIKINPKQEVNEIFNADRFEILNGVSINDMDEDEAGNLYLATNKGLMLLAASHQSLFLLHELNQSSHDCISTKINSVLVDISGYVWLGLAGDGLARYSPESNQLTIVENIPDHKHIDGCFINQLLLTDSDQIWFHSNGALSFLDLDSPDLKVVNFPRLQFYDLLANSINKMVQSPNGSLWMATQGGGINILHREHARFLNIQFQPEFSQLLGVSVKGMVQENGFIFLCTEEYGFMVFTDNGAYKSELSKQINNRLDFQSGEVLYVDYQNYQLIVGDQNQLLYYQFKQEEMVLVKQISYPQINESIPSINNVFFENESQIWLFSDEGAYLLEDDQLIEHFPTLYPVTCAIKDYREDIWFGTHGSGIYIYKNREKSIVHFRHQNEFDNSLVGNEISCLLKIILG